ncbi:cupin domain-containing protein [Amycolatopsis sp. GM8]|uniref:cupin domain-containing protein n=1 Tax=Amycolatopsis sp. GM8 TaxID=2896530 RepID=UPI001F1EC960|nr:cupin domain-containing protein [Amycolatopsis sp. GM8]
MAVGNECALYVIRRDPGYHTRPHAHDYEQISYIVEGEMWTFVGEQPYHLKAGDFHRVPRNAIHWSWNRGSVPCLTMEAASPPPPAEMLDNQELGEQLGLRCTRLHGESEIAAVRPSNGLFQIDAARHGIDVAAVETLPPVNRTGDGA